MSDEKPRLLTFPAALPDRDVVRSLALLIEQAHAGHLVGIVAGFVEPGGDVQVVQVGQMLEQDIVKLIAAVDIMRDELHALRREKKS